MAGYCIRLGDRHVQASEVAACRHGLPCRRVRRPGGLRQEQQTPGSRRRPRLTETFARIPHDKGFALYRHIGGATWVLLFELDRLILKGRGRNPVKLSGARMNAAGLNRNSRRRALHRLEAVGGCSGRMARERSEPVGDASLVPAAGLAPQHGANPTPTWAVMVHLMHHNRPPVTVCFSISICLFILFLAF